MYTLQKTNILKKKYLFFLGQVSFTSNLDRSILFLTCFSDHVSCHVRGQKILDCSMLVGPAFLRSYEEMGLLCKNIKDVVVPR